VGVENFLALFLIFRWASRLFMALFAANRTRMSVGTSRSFMAFLMAVRTFLFFGASWFLVAFFVAI